MKAFLLFLIALCAFGQNVTIHSGSDVLSETPFHDVPRGMSFEEYRDANRRISVGLMLMSIPVPGMLHFYAGEDTKGWLCVGAAGLGLASMITGALLTGDEKWPDSDYEIAQIDGNRYEKIPISITGTEVEYKLKRQESYQQISTGGAVLLGIGGILVVGQLVYDWLDGIYAIEYKRDAVRYRYGLLGREASISPQISPDGGIGLGIAIE